MVIDGDSDYVGYAYNNNKIYEIELKTFFDKYGDYLQNIVDFLKNEKMRIKKNIFIHLLPIFTIRTIIK